VDEETNKIKEHIDAERHQLEHNLDEIESRVKNATDLRAQFNKHTGWILGGAVAGGFLLSLAFRKPSNEGAHERWDGESRERNLDKPAQPRLRLSPHLDQISDTFDNIIAGLVGVVSNKLHSFVSDTVPGFREQYDGIERQRGRSSIHQIKSKIGPDNDVSAVNQF